MYGPPVVHWVQTMRERLAKVKTAGFDHQGVHLARKLASKSAIATNQPQSSSMLNNPTSALSQTSYGDINSIKIPQDMAAKVIKDGVVDYRPRLGESSKVI